MARAFLVLTLLCLGILAPIRPGLGAPEDPGLARLSYSPREGECVKRQRPQLTVYLPLGSGLIPSQARMWLDGQEVSRHMQRTTAFISYEPTQDLAAGNHSVKFSLAQHELNWSFRVEVENRIRQVRWKGPKSLQDFDEVQVELEGQPGCVAEFQIDGVTGLLPMKETAGGLYRATYKVPPSVSKVSAKLLGRLSGPGFSQSQPASERLHFSPSGFRLVLLGPDPAQPVLGDFVLEGRTRPNVTIKVKAEFAYGDGIEVISEKFGPLPKPTELKINAGDDGSFKFQLKRPTHREKLVLNLGLEAVDSDGNRSEPLLLHYRLWGKPPSPTLPQ